MRQERGRPKRKNKLLNCPIERRREEHHSGIPLFHSSFVGFSLVHAFLVLCAHMLSSSSFFFF
jgi:hypothetical protein